VSAYGGYIWFRLDLCCKASSEPSGSMKGEEFLDYLSDCQLLTKDSHGIFEVNLSLCLITHHTAKTPQRVEV
jgi:hypothetical protein